MPVRALDSSVSGGFSGGGALSFQNNRETSSENERLLFCSQIVRLTGICSWLGSFLRRKGNPKRIIWKGRIIWMDRDHPDSCVGGHLRQELDSSSKPLTQYGLSCSTPLRWSALPYSYSIRASSPLNIDTQPPRPYLNKFRSFHFDRHLHSLPSFHALLLPFATRPPRPNYHLATCAFQPVSDPCRDIDCTYGRKSSSTNTSQDRRLLGLTSTVLRSADHHSTKIRYCEETAKHTRNCSFNLRQPTPLCVEAYHFLSQHSTTLNDFPRGAPQHRQNSSSRVSRFPPRRSAFGPFISALRGRIPSPGGIYSDHYGQEFWQIRDVHTENFLDLGVCHCCGCSSCHRAGF